MTEPLAALYVRRGKNPVPVGERFWLKADMTGGPDACWPWLAGRYRTGYGTIHINQRPRQAHRVAYELAVGPIPDGLTIDHLCRNRLCVNPAHLEPATLTVNVLRGSGPASLNLRKLTCPRGHPYSHRRWVGTHWSRRCRTCDNARQRAALARDREAVNAKRRAKWAARKVAA